MKTPYTWNLYSQKLKSKIQNPKFIGYFSQTEAERKSLRLVIGKEGTVEQGAMLALYFLVDETDGVICDAKFQVFGPSSLIGACEVICDLVLQKNYDQVSRISAELIDQQVRDNKSSSSFPLECDSYLNMIVSAIDHAVCECLDIPFNRTYDNTPVTIPELKEGKIEGWESLEKEERLHIIRQIVTTEIQPYIELDAGGVKVLDLKEGKEVIIAYEGSCTTCHSSTGSTLSAIQNILQQRICSDLFVTPEL